MQPFVITKEGWAGLKHDTHMTKWIASHKDIMVEGFLRETLLPLIKPGDHVLDAGALYGDHAIPYARKCGPNGLVYAFEPNLDAFNCLAHNIINANKNGLVAPIVSINLAVGAADGVAPLKTFNNVGMTKISELGDGQCMIVPIDRLRITKLDFIHLDVEGHEFSVLTGAYETITLCKPHHIVCELDVIGKNGAESVALLSAAGYTLMPGTGKKHGVDPVFVRIQK
jgi:FkbM family methyltransferase